MISMMPRREILKELQTQKDISDLRNEPRILSDISINMTNLLPMDIIHHIFVLFHKLLNDYDYKTIKSFQIILLSAIAFIPTINLKLFFRNFLSLITVVPSKLWLTNTISPHFKNVRELHIDNLQNYGVRSALKNLVTVEYLSINYSTFKS